MDKKSRKSGVPSLAGFAALGSAVESDPAKREALRQRIYALNGGSHDVDARKLAIRINLQAKSQGVRAPIPVVRKFIEDLMSE